MLICSIFPPGRMNPVFILKSKQVNYGVAVWPDGRTGLMIYPEVIAELKKLLPKSKIVWN